MHRVFFRQTHREVRQKKITVPIGTVFAVGEIWGPLPPNTDQTHANLISTTVLSVPVGKLASTDKLFPMSNNETTSLEGTFKVPG